MKPLKKPLRTTVALNYKLAEAARKIAYKEGRSLSKQLDVWIAQILDHETETEVKL